MNACTRIKTIIGFSIIRGFLFPVAVLSSPIIFFISPGDCAAGKKEVLDYLKVVWGGMK